MNYSIENALTFDLCRAHLEQVQTGSLGHRIVHLVLGLLEMMPIIGQIIALFECVVAFRVEQLFSSPLRKPSGSVSTVSEVTFIPSSENPITSPRPTVSPAERTQTERLPYPSFAEYQRQQEERRCPVDLIVGRGTVTKGLPVLNAERCVIFTNQMVPYHPFTIDISNNPEPDMRADFLSKKELEFLPDSSVDDIYLESVYPLLWKFPALYLNAARILKEGGTMVIDSNDKVRSDDEWREYMDVLNQFFKSHNIPLSISLESASAKRNDNVSTKKFVCQKYAEVKVEWPKSLILAERALSESFRDLERKFQKKTQR